MQPEILQRALAELASESDPTVRNLQAAALCTAAFRERNVELVVVGGSAIEFYTEGAYVSGDVDLCRFGGARLELRERQAVMGALGAEGGPRGWRLAGVFVDLLGDLESQAQTPPRSLETPMGPVTLSPAEELLVERVLVATYPRQYPPALECARKLAAAALLGELVVDWREVRRLAGLPAYANWAEVARLIHEQADALRVWNPCDPDG